MTPFVHLNVLSDYSLLRSACRIRPLVARAHSLGHGAIALTDRGVLSGTPELQDAARRFGIKPIYGCRLGLVLGGSASGRRVDAPWEIGVLAETQCGYRSLVALSSAACSVSAESPVVDIETLARHREGLIVLVGGPGAYGSVATSGVRGVQRVVEEALDAVATEQLFVEAPYAGPSRPDVRPELARVAAAVGQPLVATAPVRYLAPSDREAWLAVNALGEQRLLCEEEVRLEGYELHLRSAEDARAAFAAWPDAAEATVEIAARCNVTIELSGELLPLYPTPDGRDQAAYLRDLALAGLGERYGDPPPGESVERAEMELSAIDRLGFSTYFLIVWDLVKYAKDNGIAVGPGRGAAAGSITLYCLRITDVDPLRYGLLFERFMNPERVQMPDIDIDFSVRRRDQVMRYPAEKYGAESVAQIITLGKMLPRVATREAAQLLGYADPDGDRLAGLIPDPIRGRAPTFNDCLAAGEPLAQAVAEDPNAKQIVDVAQGLEGIRRPASVHAAALLITGALRDAIPVQRSPLSRDGGDDRLWVSQYDARAITRLSGPTFDLLGLRDLDMIEDALQIVEDSTGVRHNLSDLPLDDTKTLEMLAQGDSIGVFQFGSEGMRAALRMVGPTEFEDLVALVSLYRPGAMDHIPTYAHGKHNPKEIPYRDERLRPILGPTKGIILYQEQVMQIAATFAGFSGPRAADLYKALAKKNWEAMATLKSEFDQGCGAMDTPGDVIEWLWRTSERSSDYFFNAAHAACYALISYRTAWLKRHYPEAWQQARHNPRV